MLLLTNLFCFLLIHFATAPLQINLDLTEWTNQSQSEIIYQHDCLHVAARREQNNDPIRSSLIASLFHLNITTKQLYTWSAPIDLIEHYQFYLNQISTADEVSTLGKQLFFNCTLPKFGTFCQYSLDIYEDNHSSLNELIYAYYQQEYKPTELTCYTHLQCDRGWPSACLDWTEICDNRIDCRDGVDEKLCWQLQINDCNENEYRCQDGQCVHIDYFTWNQGIFECLDVITTLTTQQYNSQYDTTLKGEPTFAQEDMRHLSRQWRTSFADVRLTGSPVIERNKLLLHGMFSDKLHSISDECWLAFLCILNEDYPADAICGNLNPNANFRVLRSIVLEHCPDLLAIPNGPVAFGHIHFLYRKQALIDSRIYRIPQYICYDEQLCSGFYLNRTIRSFNNLTCRSPRDFPAPLTEYRYFPITSAIRTLNHELSQCNTIIYDDPMICNNSKMYRCLNSTKCISKHRLCDYIVDCNYRDDEQCTHIGHGCSKNQLTTLFQCPTTGKCIHPSMVADGKCDCEVNEYDLCDDETTQMDYIRKHIAFPIICDGFTELAPLNISGRHETDETDCEQWSCNNIYTRCDGVWNCVDGVDEVDCESSPTIHCPPFHHLCVSYKSNHLMCLPPSKVDHNIVDCFDDIYERDLCGENTDSLVDINRRCIDKTYVYNGSSLYFCYESKCKSKADQPFCEHIHRCFVYPQACEYDSTDKSPSVARFLCKHHIYFEKAQIIHFALERTASSPVNTTNPGDDAMITSLPSMKASVRHYEQHCHRGLTLHVWLNNKENSSRRACLCPPSFYGNRCEYQNDRVSLTLRFRTYSDSRQTLFILLIKLIDDDHQRTIHSSHQLTYLYTQHCKTKFNLYLLYSAGRKNQTKNYSIHIDVYEKTPLTYRGSLFLAVKFLFLPVQRIATELLIPGTNEKAEKCVIERCVHGRCIQYSNVKSGITFCHCKEGWSGRDCTIPHHCTCSADSLCVGLLPNNRSLCVCPSDRWGPQCLLSSITCDHERCLNGGTCISINENVISEKRFVCVCVEGFSGDRCELADAKLVLFFDKNIRLPPYILVHFIEIIYHGPIENGSAYQVIPPNQNSVTFYRSRPYHIAFIQSYDNYYLVIVQKTFNRSQTIIRTITSSDRCPKMSEVFNDTIIHFHLLRRIKYYHLPCQNRSLNLSCFYDSTHFCLCYDFGVERLANCFEFDYQRKFDCYGESNCQNEAQCLQDRHSCPQTSVCVCPPCFYGKLCQFRSNLFGLSLDAILADYIQSRTSLLHQPSIVQTGAALTIIITLAGLVNGVLSLITFRSAVTRQTGCGFYLFTASIVTLFTMIIFAMKFFILLIVQITNVQNRAFLLMQCLLLDYFLQIGLNMDRWMGAFVAVERTIASMQGTQFNKTKVKKLLNILSVLLCSSSAQHTFLILFFGV